MNKEKDDSSLIICNLKEFRQKKGLTQSRLADLLGIKRQAVYDIESGRYLPNTLIALRLARLLNVTVEEIFEEKTLSSISVEMTEETPADSRVSVVKVRDHYIGYPASSSDFSAGSIQAADGIYLGNGRVQLLKNERSIENTVALLGCDPAFNILSSYVSSSDTALHCRFASSRAALEGLAAGYAHVAGTHLHKKGASETNIALAHEIMGSQKTGIMAFADYEEGFIVAHGNPLNITGPEDLLRSSVRFVNREPGAALHYLIEDLLKDKGIPLSGINSFGRYVHSHAEGAQLVSFGLADAVMGLKAVAEMYQLDFIPLSSVRCDLVIPSDLWELRPVKVLLDALQTRRLRMELQSLAGYNTENTGNIIEIP